MRGKGTLAPKPLPMKYIVSGTSEQLGMQPRCDPTIRTAPTKVYGRVSWAWVFSGRGYQKPRDYGSPRRSWGSKYTMGLELQHGG